MPKLYKILSIIGLTLSLSALLLKWASDAPLYTGDYIQIVALMVVAIIICVKD